MLRLNVNDQLAVALAAVCLTLTQIAMAGPVNTPNTFTSGTPAIAAEVNDNFAAVETAVNDNDARIVQLTAENAALTERIDNVIANNQKLLDELAEAAAFIEDLRAVLSLQPDNQGNPAVVFSGVNVHINNGEGATNSINGVGNLIVGYDEPSLGRIDVCSDGQFVTQADCVANGEVFSAIHKSGSHTVVVGAEHNYSQAVGLVVGFRNTSNGSASSVTGGAGNMASGQFSSVTGGANNTAIGSGSSVTGGDRNTASGVASSIAGGANGTASGFQASVTGGAFNTASGDNSSVTSGFNNTASALGASITGGDNNTASGEIATVTGGNNNSASGLGASITGGDNNTASGENSSVTGGTNNTASAENASVSGGSSRSAEDENDWVAGKLREDF